MKGRLTFKIMIIFSIFGILLFISGIYLYRGIADIGNEWTKFVDSVEKRRELISELKSAIGYGGGIHHFKNYVIRGTDKYSNRFI